jgi:hypothetical protein
MNYFLLADTTAGWSTEIVAVLTGVAAIIGSAIAWISSKGFETYRTWRDFRLTERERMAKLKAAEARPFSTEQMWEDKNLAMGYKALLYSQDRRIRELEDRDIKRTQEMQAVHTQLLNCLTEHAEANAKYEACVKELDEERKKRERLERQLRRLGAKANIPIEEEENGDKSNL